MQILTPLHTSGKGAPRLYLTEGTCYFPWHQHGLEKCDQWADSGPEMGQSFSIASSLTTRTFGNLFFPF